MPKRWKTTVPAAPVRTAADYYRELLGYRTCTSCGIRTLMPPNTPLAIRCRKCA